MENRPLAYRMCPRTLDEFVGQEHILGKDKLLFKSIKADRLSSIILWGPPGCGKTALARVIAGTTKNSFKKLNAVLDGKNDIRNIVEEAKNPIMNPSGKVVLFIDEIHRFNKAQQDILLPYVEEGTVILIGATTENPYFEVNQALLSRSTIFKLESMNSENIKKILENAIADKERGLGNYSIQIEKNGLEYLADICNGDVRRALNGLEIAVLSSDVDAMGNVYLSMDNIKESIQERKNIFDKSGDAHYDNISGFIKSMRGSSPDGALFYLARALNGGEDPMFLARRIMICASEDVGIADSNALVVAQAAATAVHMVGMPEARIILAHAAVYVAKAPKSNAAYRGINKALEDVKNRYTGEVPLHLRNAPIEGMREEHGYSVGYKYAYAYGGYVEQEYLPDEVKGTVYYEE